MPKTGGISVQTDVFKSTKELLVKAESTALWSPTALVAGEGRGKKFLLQGIILSLNEVAGYWEFLDGATEIFAMNVKAIAATELPMVIQFPIGYESITAGNKLNLKPSAESKKVSLVVYGTEVA